MDVGIRDFDLEPGEKPNEPMEASLHASMPKEPSPRFSRFAKPFSRSASPAMSHHCDEDDEAAELERERAELRTELKLDCDIGSVQVAASWPFHNDPKLQTQRCSPIGF